tara:strand:- start:1166 stop:1954 length:789 start_codon:yes stop_codon:yes gene_type:complete
VHQTYSDRFENILSNSNLTKRDREFIESLKSQYTKKNRLSIGQSNWFGKLEERYAKIAVGKPTGEPHMVARLSAISSMVLPNTWAAGFVQSLTEQNNQGRNLSEKQIQHLRNIESEHSVDKRAERQKWFSNYDNYHREIAKLCADYYSSTPYYGDLVKKIRNNSEFIPTQKQWEAMCQNKYAQKIIKIHESKPKFSIKSVVQLRKTSPHFHNKDLCDKPAFIIESDAAPPAACNGGRWYSVLFAGESTTMKLMEKDIKSAKL